MAAVLASQDMKGIAEKALEEFSIFTAALRAVRGFERDRQRKRLFKPLAQRWKKKIFNGWGEYCYPHFNQAVARRRRRVGHQLGQYGERHIAAYVALEREQVNLRAYLRRQGRVQEANQRLQRAREEEEFNEASGALNADLSTATAS